MLRLNEDAFEDVVVLTTPEVQINPIEVPEEEVEQPAALTPDLNAIAAMINKSIIGEVETVDLYNSILVSLPKNLAESDKVAKIIKDILDEEHVHIGQLQAALEYITPNAILHQQGEVEGENQITEKLLNVARASRLNEDYDMLEDDELSEDVYEEALDRLESLDLDDDQYFYYKEALDDLYYDDILAAKRGKVGYKSFNDIIADAERSAQDAESELLDDEI